MTKQEYLLRQFSRTNKKNLENYVVSRIWHKLDDLEVKISTQQYISRPNGHALTDLYFPQFGFHVEVDEPHHEKNLELDINREADIVDATNHKIVRIKDTGSIQKLNVQIDNVVEEILNLKAQNISNKSFVRWEVGGEFNISRYLRQGYFEDQDDVRFRRIVDACNTFGHNYAGCQRAWVVNNLNPSQYLWFPKFYENADWDNRISDDGLTITEFAKNEENMKRHFQSKMIESVERITFPRIIDNLGFAAYKFRGVFKVVPEKSFVDKSIVYEKVCNRVSLLPV